MESHCQNIIHSLSYLSALLHTRLALFFGKEQEVSFTCPQLSFSDDSDFYKLITGKDLLPEEKSILIIAVAPHLQPNLFDNIIQQYLPNGGEFAEIGGVKGTNHRNMLPTGETVLFILAGNDLHKRFEIQQLLLGDSILVKENILFVEAVKEGEPIMSGRLIISEEWLNKIVFGKDVSPKFSPDFPAKKLSTGMTWDDLVLNNYTFSQITDIQIWLQHNTTIMQDAVLQNKIKPGYRVLFYGSSGTGKTITATL